MSPQTRLVCILEYRAFADASLRPQAWGAALSHWMCKHDPHLLYHMNLHDLDTALIKQMLASSILKLGEVELDALLACSIEGRDTLQTDWHFARDQLELDWKMGAANNKLITERCVHRRGGVNRKKHYLVKMIFVRK